MNKVALYALGGVVVAAGTVYVLSDEEQRQKYRTAAHNGLAAGGKEAAKHCTSKGLILLAEILFGRKR